MKTNFPGDDFDPMVDNPENYKLHIFYYNKKDPRVRIPKRYRYFGWTINFARPYVWWCIGIIVAIVIVAKILTYIL